MKGLILKPERKIYSPKMYLDPPRNEKKKVVLPGTLYVKMNDVLEAEPVYEKGKKTVINKVNVFREETQSTFSHYCEKEGIEVRMSLSDPVIKNYRIDDIEGFYKILARDCSVESMGTACRSSGVSVSQDYFSNRMMSGDFKKSEPIKSYFVVPTERNPGNFIDLEIVRFYHDLGNELNLTGHEVKRIERNMTAPRTVNGPRVSPTLII